MLGALDDLSWDYRQADNLRMRMLLRSARIGPVILENNYMAHSRVAVKIQKAMAICPENPLEVRNRKLRHRPVVSRTFNQDFMKADTVHARFARSQAARQTDLTRRRKHRKPVDNGTEHPTVPLASEAKAFLCRKSFFSGTEWTARQEWCCLNSFPRGQRSLPRLARSGAIITDSPVILFSRISDISSHLEIDYFSNISLSGAMIFRQSDRYEWCDDYIAAMDEL